MSESYIRTYWEEIQSGKAIVGYYVKQQMKMLLKNLENPALKIDFAESEKRIRFIEKECRHSEAPFAGKPFILMTWQKAIIEAIFAIKIYNAELQKYIRKYQEVLLVVGRKNGKIPVASAITLAEWCCGEMGTKILYGSNDYDQADLLYMATDAMREASPKLARCTRRNQKGIFFGNLKQKTHVGKFTSQNKGSIRKIIMEESFINFSLIIFSYRRWLFSLDRFSGLIGKFGTTIRRASFFVRLISRNGKFFVTDWTNAGSRWFSSSLGSKFSAADNGAGFSTRTIFRDNKIFAANHTCASD